MLGAGDRVVCCVHGSGRSGDLFAEIGCKLAAKGFAVIVLDLPGHGRAATLAPSGKPLKARGGADGALVLGVLTALGARETTFLAEGGGGATFVRAAVSSSPESPIFGANHVLLNPVVSTGAVARGAGRA